MLVAAAAARIHRARRLLSGPGTLGQTEVFILNHARVCPGVTAAEIETIEGFSKSQISIAIKILELGGLVRRDGNRRGLELSSQGAELFLGRDGFDLSLVNAAIGRLSDRDRSVLMGLLQALNERILGPNANVVNQCDETSDLAIASYMTAGRLLRLCRSAGHTNGQAATILDRLWLKGPMSGSDLFNEEVMALGNQSRIGRHLAGVGLCTITEDPANWQRRIHGLSPKGADLFLDRPLPDFEPIHVIIEKLHNDELASLNRGVEAMADVGRDSLRYFCDHESSHGRRRARQLHGGPK